MPQRPANGLTPARLEAFCRGWPGVTRDFKWGGDLVLSVDAKMFVIAGTERRAVQRLMFKVADERFLELTDRDGFVPAPYLARARWVAVTDPARVPTAELKALVRQAYLAVRAKLSKRRQAELRLLPDSVSQENDP